MCEPHILPALILLYGQMSGVITGTLANPSVLLPRRCPQFLACPSWGTYPSWCKDSNGIGTHTRYTCDFRNATASTADNGNETQRVMKVKGTEQRHSDFKMDSRILKWRCLFRVTWRHRTCLLTSMNTWSLPVSKNRWSSGCWHRTLHKTFGHWRWEGLQKIWIP